MSSTVARPSDSSLRAALRRALLFAGLKLLLQFALTLWTQYIGYSYFRPKVKRIRFADQQVEIITRLKDFHSVVINGSTQVNVAPDGSPIFTRDTGYQEIYALNVRWP